ncbi:hypothetical protein ST201phi2-1p002 [Pseudomonas phage 201phi2-1]|uniref:Uncharacterized protein n=1 Tax=Pseudomonas phage 201phi2-1 TaxID=198110 RepID=B3FJX8_BP201|nr:hypothetical protein ST201phi2-1p002 [Pseudomonas phage 201phi2-1]ABY62837.1 hypothetical protein 201phi2-1p002 [Pseudomonas phage 201phi2-1]
MTLIAKPAVPDTEVLNHIGRDLLLKDEDGSFKLQRHLKILTEEGLVHQVSFAQVDGLLNILDSTRETPPCSPLQYLITHYDLKDLVELGKDGWLVPEYQVVVMHSSKTVRFEGKLTRVGSIDKEFTFALGGFDFIQQLSLARCIASLGKEFEQVIGTFDCTYVFKTGPDGISVSTDIGV